MDGLAAGIALIAAGFRLALFLVDGNGPEALMAVAFMGAMAGFLFYNLHPASIFMGDSGALFLGFALATISLVGVMKSVAAIALAVPLLIIGVPIFLVIGFALFTLMATMQQAVFAEYQQLLGATAPAEAPASLRESFALVNRVQLGADVAFDIFYSLGIILISIVIVRTRGLGRVVGAYGLVVATGLLALNIGFFPTPPAAAGSVDLGPATIGWWIGLFVLDGHLNKREISDSA